MAAIPNTTLSTLASEAPDESLIWVADLLASLDLPPMQLVEDEPEDTGPQTGLSDEASLVDLTPEEITQDSQELNLPPFEYDAEEDGSVFEAIFGWIGDLINSLFGGGPNSGDGLADQPSDAPAPDMIPADVAEDTIFTALEPDQAYLDALEAELDELEMDLLI